MEFVPSNIIKTPDFGAMAQNAMQQKRQDINEMNNWMDSNKKKEGAYLEGDKPAVQDAWNKYQQELDSAVESGDRASRRKADEAYGAYAQLAGTAMANADQYRSQVAAYKADPSKYSIGGQEFLSLSDEYRRTKRNADDIVLAVQNPFVVAQSMKYDLANPVDQAQKMAQMSSAKIKDFYNDTGQLNANSARRYAEELADSFIRANESSVEKAMAWGGIRTGYAGGEDGMLNSMEELEFLRNQPEEKREEFIEKYKQELVENYMKVLPSDLKQKDDKDGRNMPLSSYDVNYPSSDPQKSPSKVNFYALAKPDSGLKGVIGFGMDPNGDILLEEQVEVKEINNEGDEIKVKKTVRRQAEASEVARLKSIVKKDYGVSLDKIFVSSQEEPAESGMTEAEYQQWLKENDLDG